VIEWVPAVSADVVTVAWPLASSNPDPSAVDPSQNVTVPVGVLDPVTVAVNVTPSPNVEGLMLDVTLVVDVALVTVSVTSTVRTMLSLVPVMVSV
jgi:hypothetical protein